MSSSPSTPRTARSASPTGDSPKILTPGRKIKAMLAAFDSDSESDDGKSKPQKPASLFTSRSNINLTKERPITQTTHSDEDDDEEEDADDIVMPKGRVAARMQAEFHANDSTAHNSKTETAFERLSKRLRAEKETAQHEAEETEENAASSDDDELPTAGPRRRLTKAKQVLDNDEGSDRSPSPARSFSPLFMSSPAGSRRDPQDGSGGGDSDDDYDDDQPKTKGNARFLALVAQKRKEREERERLEAEKKAARLEQLKQFSSEINSGDESGDDDDGSGRKLTQQARPARKASKKALEEMSRETQRMSRNMQLAHQARTKKKITKESFFARFNFMQNQEPAAAGPSVENSSTTAGSQNSSDAEAQKGKETPRTSPVLGPVDKDMHEQANVEVQQPVEQDDNGDGTDQLPDLDAVLSGTQQQLEKSLIVQNAEVALQHAQPDESKPKERKVLTKPPVRVILSRQIVAQNQKDDSDDDLEVITSPAKCRRIAAFENLPAKKHQESASMLKLKALAHLTSPTRKRTTMNTAELSATLLYQARQQAAKERQERIEELRAKGIIIETAEERAAMEDEVEDLVEKARKEAEEIAKREKKAAKKQGVEEGQSEDEDADYEMSGSDGEEAYGDGEEDEDDEEGSDDENEEEEGLIQNMAGEGDDSEDAQSEAITSDEEAEMPTARRKRPTRVISDDEDDEQDKAEPKTPAKPIPPTAQFAERPQFPGLPTSSNLTMSLTQAFAGTLDQNQMDSSAVLPSLPDPARAPADFHDSDSQMMVKDSQEQRAESTDLLAGYAQSEARVSESPAPRSVSQFSQIPDPTQDAGFVYSPFDPSKRFTGTPPATVETVLVSQNNSPIAKRKGKLLRRGRAGDLPDIEEDDFEVKASAFDVMKKAAKKPVVPFDRTKSKAKEIVEEAAEESEDEYAGLGGASDDSEDEENAYDRDMINDNSGEVVDEKELAALNANHQRAADEKQVAKLLKDITTGALRRRRGGDDDFDLDDSDDEHLARRRRKQREFARMRQALLADERVGALAENPKKAAFFKAIEDRADMDDDFELEFLENDTQGDTSSQDVTSDAQQDAAAQDSNKRKRPLEASAEDIANRPPPHLRRTRASAMSKKPSTLAEIRDTLSFLTETHDYDSFHEDTSMDEEQEDTPEDSEMSDDPQSAKQTKDGFTVPPNPRRTRGPVVDRLALLRQASSNSASSTLANGRMAFQVGSGDPAGNIGFRPPPLLRRETSTSSSSSSGVSTTSHSNPRVSKPAVPAGAALVKKGSVNYYTAAREREREKEIRSKERSSGSNIAALLNKHAGSGLSALGNGQWE